VEPRRLHTPRFPPEMGRSCSWGAGRAHWAALRLHKELLPQRGAKCTFSPVWTRSIWSNTLSMSVNCPNGCLPPSRMVPPCRLLTPACSMPLLRRWLLSAFNSPEPGAAAGPSSAPSSSSPLRGSRAAGHPGDQVSTATIRPSHCRGRAAGACWYAAAAPAVGCPFAGRPRCGSRAASCRAPARQLFWSLGGPGRLGARAAASLTATACGGRAGAVKPLAVGGQPVLPPHFPFPPSRLPPNLCSAGRRCPFRRLLLHALLLFPACGELRFDDHCICELVTPSFHSFQSVMLDSNIVPRPSASCFLFFCPLLKSYADLLPTSLSPCQSSLPPVPAPAPATPSSPPSCVPGGSQEASPPASGPPSSPGPPSRVGHQRTASNLTRELQKVTCWSGRSCPSCAHHHNSMSSFCSRKHSL
jgi:hypothetical protein